MDLIDLCPGKPQFCHAAFRDGTGRRDAQPLSVDHDSKKNTQFLGCGTDNARPTPQKLTSSQLRHPPRPTLGLLIRFQIESGDVNSYANLLIRGVQAAAHARDCNLLIACGLKSAMMPVVGTAYHNPWPVYAPEYQFVPVGPWNTDGLIVAGGGVSTAQAQYLQNLLINGFPVISVGAGILGPSVTVDNAEGIRLAVAHLAAHGHRCIAFIAGYPGETNSDSAQRLDGYWAGMRENNLEMDTRLVAYGLHYLETSRRAAKQLLDSGVPFTAILASNDDSAIGAMEVLQAAGRRVPQDVAVIGFDDRLESLAQNPLLTTVHNPIFEISQLATERVLDWISGMPPLTTTLQVAPYLKIRHSCGCLMHTQPLELTSAPPAVQWAQAMTQALAAETSATQTAEAYPQCLHLAQTLSVSLERETPELFYKAWVETLQQAETSQVDIHGWQVVLSVLHKLLPASQLLLEELLQARLMASESLRRQHLNYRLHRNHTEISLERLTAQLNIILEEKRIFEQLHAFLPVAGVMRADLALFEPEDHDPTAWSVLQTPAPREISRRFPTREFPPTGLYPLDIAFQLALFPVVIQEQIIGFGAFQTDDLGSCAALIQGLALALRSARLYREAEEANRLKSRFLATVSHELRTPLNVIVGLSQMQTDDLAQSGQVVPEQYRHDLEQINTNAQHLSWLIRDVLDLASSQAGQLRLACTLLNLAEVLQVLTAAGEQMTREKGLTWQANLPAELPTIWGDVTRLRQVGLNLISNAVKFTTSGQVSLNLTTDEKTVTISVTDTGLGIPLAEQQSIFDEFRQSERTTARGYGGLGLGLAISKRLVELHGGQIGVHSSGQEQSGSTFYFCLPILAVTSQPRFYTPASLTQSTMLVTTQIDSGERLRTYLGQQGFDATIRLVDPLTDWISDLLTEAELPGAIVLDQPVAVEQGWELLKAIKQTPSGQDILVLFYTLEDDTGSLLALDYLHKPLNVSELTQALERQGLNADQETKTILVVDDEPGILDIHTRMVQAQSPAYRVFQARNGREALEIIQASPPDLILLDLMMPELDGFGVLEALRLDPATRDIPVMVLTAQILTEADMTRLNRGVTTVLEKGIFSLAETLTRMESALARSRKLGSEAQRLVRKAMAYIHAHYAEPLTREEIARYVNVSSRHLTHCFDQEIGLSPMAYLNRYRIRQAKTLLAGSKKRIIEIALEVGFSRSGYFAQVFRKEVGQTPQAYRATQAGTKHIFGT